MASSPPIAPTFPAATLTRTAPIGATRRWVVLGLLCLAFIAAYFDRVNLSVVIGSKDFVKSFALTPTDIGLLSSAFFWSYAPLQFVAGWTVDRFGAKRSLAVGFLVWSIFSACSGLATGFYSL